MTTVLVAVLVVVALLAVLVISLLRSHAEILRALHDLGVSLDPGSERVFHPTIQTASSSQVDPRPGPLGTVHELRGVTPDGEVAMMSVSGADPVLLAFLTSGCGTCRGFWEVFAPESRQIIGGVEFRVVVVTHGAEVESPVAVAELAGGDLDVLMSSEAYEDYGVAVAPFFVLIAGGRIIGEGAASSWEQLRGLLARAVADTGAAPGRTAAMRARRRAADADEALGKAGIAPGDPSLYPDRSPS